MIYGVLGAGLHSSIEAFRHVVIAAIDVTHIKHPHMLTISMLIMFGSFLMSLSQLVGPARRATVKSRT